MAGDLLSAMVQRAKAYASPIAQSYASGNRPYRVEIHRPGPPQEYDRTTQQMVNPADILVYRGAAKIGDLGGPIELDIGGERITMASAQISIDYDTEIDPEDPNAQVRLAPRVDDVVTVLEDEQSLATHIAGRTFTVTAAGAGGHYGIGWVLQALGVSPSRRT